MKTILFTILPAILLVKTEKLRQHRMQVNTWELGNGIYIVTVTSKGHTENLKLIIQR